MTSVQGGFVPCPPVGRSDEIFAFDAIQGDGCQKLESIHRPLAAAAEMCVALKLSPACSPTKTSCRNGTDSCLFSLANYDPGLVVHYLLHLAETERGKRYHGLLHESGYPTDMALVAWRRLSLRFGSSSTAKKSLSLFLLLLPLRCSSSSPPSAFALLGFSDVGEQFGEASRSSREGGDTGERRLEVSLLPCRIQIPNTNARSHVVVSQGSTCRTLEARHPPRRDGH